MLWCVFILIRRSVLPAIKMQELCLEKFSEALNLCQDVAPCRGIQVLTASNISA